MSKPWFRHKKFGYGAGLPTCWQGWALMIGYIVAVGLEVLLCKAFLPPALGGPLSLIILVALTIPLLRIAQARTEGGWHWRWGKGQDKRPEK